MPRFATGAFRTFLITCTVALSLGQAWTSIAAEFAVTQAGAPGAVSGDFPFSLGFRFTVNQEISVTELGRYDWLGDGIDNVALAQLYNWDTGAILGAAGISSTAAGVSDGGPRDVQFGFLRTPVSLRPGNNYLVAVEVTNLDFGSDVAATAHGVINSFCFLFSRLERSMT